MLPKKNSAFVAGHSDDVTGFTLVELLITITIMAILTAAVIPTFTGYLRNQDLRQAQDQLKSDLRVAQNKALTGALSDQTVDSNPIAFWGIKFTSGGTGTGSSHYDIFVSDDVSNAACNNVAPSQIQGYGDLVNTIEVKSNNNRCIFFSIENGSISTINFPTNQIIVGYKNSTASGDCRRLLFNSNGLIYSNTSVLCT